MKNTPRTLLLVLVPALAACGAAVAPGGGPALLPVWVDAPRPTPDGAEWTVGSLYAAAPVAEDVALDHFDEYGKHASALGLGWSIEARDGDGTLWSAYCHGGAYMTIVNDGYGAVGCFDPS